MLLTNDDNLDADALPFADYDFTSTIQIDQRDFEKSILTNQVKTYKKTKRNPNNDNKTNNSHNIFSYLYFENMHEENNFITFIPYTGPSNTTHLGKSLYLPQSTMEGADESKISFQRFLQDYDKAIASLTCSSDSLSLHVYLRFGIFYITKMQNTLPESVPLREFRVLRNQGKKLKTAFYTCKGVTSPKRLLSTLTKLDYHQISSNNYSYDVQLYAQRRNIQTILHFQYNEQFCCNSVFVREQYPMNFDFIRNKTSSLFRSIDDSYADIFDFRIQLAQGKDLTKTDPIVLSGLRGVPIDQVLFIDKKTHLLHISPKLQRFVKYLKCTRSSSYQNSNDQFVIHIGTYEEFQLNRQGQFESSMKASNTMTIELLDLNKMTSGKKLYDTGMWFSTLCQTSVDLPSTTTENISNRSCKWFPGIFSSGKKCNQSIKQMNVSQLTTYKTQTSHGSYTSEELALVKKILYEENLRNILLSRSDGKSYNRNDIEREFENVMKKLKTSSVPSVDQAIKKVQLAYELLCNDLVNS